MEKRRYVPNPVYTIHANIYGSSAIKSMSYDEKNQILLIHFRAGGQGRFRDVPISHFRGLQTASSAGTYFHNYIKGVYQTY